MNRRKQVKLNNVKFKMCIGWLPHPPLLFYSPIWKARFTIVENSFVVRTDLWLWWLEERKGAPPPS
jgi:hypothetical protein